MAGNKSSTADILATKADAPARSAFCVDESAENDDWRFRRDLFDVATNLETVAWRDEEIYHDNVRLQGCHRLIQCGAVSNAAHHLA